MITKALEIKGFNQDTEAVDMVKLCKKQAEDASNFLELMQLMSGVDNTEARLHELHDGGKISSRVAAEGVVFINALARNTYARLNPVINN